ncbi:hypothetical protein FNT36_21200 [Hymenobacter setariae]|uniref:Uncharacterized protein n=1 Tax=Hymenobacter setariae TaxID=2594794 RepID=A0A558BMF7_9BACT|nr:hypothetical protein [Hymenobacter setariae]TVT37694.1 hypothetical protein FNT36_21200 [Hymenobacter setariae]
MKSFVVISAIALSASALSSCLTTQEPTCNSTSYVPIVSAIGPKTVGVNQPAVFAIGYTLGSSCGTLSNVSAVPNANGSLVQVGVSANYVGCSCSPTTTVSQTTYQFQAATAGTYRIQFLSGNNIFITDTVIVK